MTYSEPELEFTFAKKHSEKCAVSFKYLPSAVNLASDVTRDSRQT